MPDVIVTHRLTKYYDAQCAVDGLDLRVAQGTVYGLLGRNGAGKTTAIKMLLGMAHPSYGRAEVLGEDAAHLRPETRARIAYLAEGHPLYRWMTVGQAVRFTAAVLRPLEPAAGGTDPRSFRASLPAADSPGSRAASRPRSPWRWPWPRTRNCLILDDPTLGLDTVVRRDFLESLIQIIQRRGRTILFSSHILGDVERVAERIGIMVDGVLRVDCPTDHFKDSVRKVVLEFAGEPPPPPAVPRLVNCRQVGCKLELVVVGFGEEHERLFAALGPRRTEVIEFNLEDAFIEYTRGPRRPLPLFVDEEVSHV